jgi:hypothetical protein
VAGSRGAAEASERLVSLGIFVLAAGLNGPFLQQAAKDEPLEYKKSPRPATASCQ